MTILSKKITFFPDSMTVSHIPNSTVAIVAKGGTIMLFLKEFSSPYKPSIQKVRTRDNPTMDIVCKSALTSNICNACMEQRNGVPRKQEGTKILWDK